MDRQHLGAVLVFALLGSSVFQNVQGLGFSSKTLSTDQRLAFLNKLGAKQWAGPATKCTNDLTGLALNPAGSIPTEYHVHKTHPDCAPLRIKDQGACGSCWAFCTTEALSQRMCLASGAIERSFSVAPQKLVTCDKSCQAAGFCQAGCNGGYIDLAFEYLANSGGTVENCVPYASGGGSDTYSGNCSAVQAKIDTCQLSNGNDSTSFQAGLCFYHSSSDLASVQRDILQLGPVVAGFNVYNDFFGYSSGVYSCPSSGSSVGGHAVVLVGWGTENGVDYWVAQNSWTSDWGEGGFFRIKRGINTCGIEGNIVTVKTNTLGVTFSSAAYNSAALTYGSMSIFLLVASSISIVLLI